MKQRKKLMLPGPVDVFDETLEAMSQPVRSNFTEDWGEIYGETIGYLKQVFQTQNDIYIMTAPGSGAIEASIASLFMHGDKVAAVSNGPFANRAIEILRHFGCTVIEVPETWGKAGSIAKMRQTLDEHPDIVGIAVVANETGTGVRNPVKELTQLAHERNIPIFVDAVSGMGGYNLPVDEWGIDLICTSSNKALEMAPGLGIICVSPRAWEIIDAKKEKAHRGWYYNLSTWKQYGASRPGAAPSPTTMATSMIVGLHASLKRIVEGETLQGHWDRYVWAQKAVRVGLSNIGFPMLADEADASFTVTTVCKHEAMEHEQELRDYLAANHNYTVSGTWGELTGKAFRVAHMGRASTPEYLIPFLLGIEEYVRNELKVDVPVGASLVGIK